MNTRIEEQPLATVKSGYWKTSDGVSPFPKSRTVSVPIPMKRRKRLSEKSIHNLFMGIGLLSITVLILIMIFLFMEGLPLFSEVSLKEFLFGNFWYPTDDPPEFGIFPLIVGTVSVTFLSGIVSIPLGIMTAIYLAEIASKRVCEVAKPLVELLAALPSVVIGFFGMVVVAPFLQEMLDIPVGLNLFNAALMLAFMSVPTICSISEDAIHNVPDTLREASLGLGATRFETISRVTLPAALSGISTAVILGMSRAVGETMVVLMVAGGAAMVPESLFDPVRPMPASIAAEMGEAPFRGEHYQALFATGIVLFVFTILFNLAARHISKKYRQAGETSL